MQELKQERAGMSLGGTQETKRRGGEIVSIMRS